MVSPCSSSSKQIVHSPESLDRMSSEKETRHRSKMRQERFLTSNHLSDLQFTQWILHNHLFNLWYPEYLSWFFLYSKLDDLYFRSTAGYHFPWTIMCKCLIKVRRVSTWSDRTESKSWWSFLCLPAYSAMTSPRVNTRGKGVTGAVCSFFMSTC